MHLVSINETATTYRVRIAHDDENRVVSSWDVTVSADARNPTARFVGINTSLPAFEQTNESFQKITELAVACALTKHAR